MKMKESQFRALLIELCPNVKANLEDGYSSVVLIAHTVAARLWIDHRREDGKSRALRKQLRHLETKGCFDFTEWDGNG